MVDQRERLGCRALGDFQDLLEMPEREDQEESWVNQVLLVQQVNLVHLGVGECLGQTDLKE